MSISNQLQDLFNNRDFKAPTQHFESNGETPYFTKLKTKKTKPKKEKNTLILWDIENISFKGSISEFSSLNNKNNTIKIVSIRKNGAYDVENCKSNIYYIKKQLINKKWHIHHEKKDADDGLYSFWNKYKATISQLILISNDKDFEKILLEAIEMNIEYKILYTHNNTRWISKYNNVFIDDDNAWMNHFKDEQ